MNGLPIRFQPFKGAVELEYDDKSTLISTLVAWKRISLLLVYEDASKLREILTAKDSREDAVRDLAQNLNAGASDILILFSGADAPADEAARLKNELEKACPMTEVILLDGGQPVYDYILVLC